MAFFYVKSGGTATGDGGRYASQKSGSWATAFSATSEYYDNLYDADGATTPPAAGDIIFCSNSHNFSGDNGLYTGINAGVTVVSVDDANCDQYKPGAKENLTDTADDYYPAELVLMAGLDLETGDNVIQLTGNEPAVILQDCILRPDGIGDAAVHAGQDGGHVTLQNVEIAPNSSNALGFVILNASAVLWRGGSVSAAMTDLCGAFGGGGGARLEIEGVDLSNVTNVCPSQASTADNTLISLKHCKLNSSISLPTPASFGKRGQRFEMFNCDDGTGDALYRFFMAEYAGTVKNNDSVYVTAMDGWYGGSDKSSLEVSTSANCGHNAPFIFELIGQVVDLSSASSDVLTIDLVTDNMVLTDTDIAAYLVYPDGTTSVQANIVTSGLTATGYLGVDPLAAGSTLPSSSLGASDWTGEPATPNFYKLELDTSGDAGQLGAIGVRIEVYKPSIAAGDLYIHPVLTLS